MLCVCYVRKWIKRCRWGLCYVCAMYIMGMLTSKSHSPTQKLDFLRVFWETLMVFLQTLRDKTMWTLLILSEIGSFLPGKGLRAPFHGFAPPPMVNVGLGTIVGMPCPCFVALFTRRSTTLPEGGGRGGACRMFDCGFKGCSGAFCSLLKTALRFRYGFGMFTWVLSRSVCKNTNRISPKKP